MRLVPFHMPRLDFKRNELSERELAAADMIAQAIKDESFQGPVGSFIWKICRKYEVDQKRVARHLATRNRKRTTAQ
jgi:hypothetical protein